MKRKKEMIMRSMNVWNDSADTFVLLFFVCLPLASEIRRVVVGRMVKKSHSFRFISPTDFRTRVFSLCPSSIA